MDEDIHIINANTRNEKIKNFFIKNKNRFIISISAIVLLVFGYFINEDFKDKNKVKIANNYNQATIEYEFGDKNIAKKDLINLIKEKDKTYSPLALYFLIDNDIIKEFDNANINLLFDTIIDNTNLEKEIKNLLVYKKALFNSENESENNLIKILNPVINSDSIWKSHALYLLAEYFYSKGEKQKAKEFFNQILILESSNLDIKKESQKRLNRDFSE